MLLQKVQNRLAQGSVSNSNSRSIHNGALLDFGENSSQAPSAVHNTFSGDLDHHGKLMGQYTNG